MRIHAISLKNFRGIKNLEVTDIPETGVTVIHGRNEAGKTTILKAIEALFNFKYNSKAAAVKALQTANADVSPEAQMEFSVGPYRLRISKNWLKQASALLEVITPHSKPYTGEEAESQLQDILSKHLDKNLFSALFMSQDDMHEGIKAAGIASVAGVLSNQSGAEGESGDDAEQTTALMKQVDKTYERYYTLKSGNETNELKAARSSFHETETELSQAQSALDALTEFVQRYEQAQLEQERAEKEIPEAQTEVAEADEKLTAIEGLKAQVDALDNSRELAQRDAELAQNRLTTRQKLRADIAQATSAVADLDKALEAAKDKELAEKAEIDKLNELAGLAKTKQQETRMRSKEARANLNDLEQKQKAFQLHTKAAQVEEVAGKLADVRTAIEKFGPHVKDADVTRVEKLEQDLELNRRLRDVAVAKLVLSSLTSQTITIDREEVEVSDSAVNVELHEGLSLTIGDVTARYQPGAGTNSAEELDSTISDLTTQLSEFLEKLACENVKQVREKRNALNALLQEREQFERELRRMLDGEDLEQLRIRAAASTAVEEAPQESAITQAHEELEAAEEAADEANREVENAEAQLKPWAERPARNALIRVQSDHEHALKQQQLLEEQVANIAEEDSDESLEKAHEERQAALGDVDAKTKLAEAELAQAQPELAEKLAEGAHTRLKRLREQLRLAENSQLELTGQIRMQAGAAERVEKAAAAHESARNILESVELRAHAVKHLREVLLRHQSQARERYAAPFAQQLGELASRVFDGDVQFHLNEDLVVEQRTLDGVTVNLKDLSGGAREQMAILTRFAIAELLSKDGEQGAPVVVDDALGSTDAGRIKLMATLFADIGEKSQVLVFTCEPSRYDRVPGSNLLDIDQLKSTPAV